MQPLCSNQYMKTHLQHLTMEFRMSARIGNKRTYWMEQGLPILSSVVHMGCILRHLYLHTIKYTRIYIKILFNYFSVYII